MNYNEVLTPHMRSFANRPTFVRKLVCNYALQISDLQISEELHVNIG